MNWLKLAPYLASAALLALIWSWHLAKVHAADRHGYERAMGEVAIERSAAKDKADKLREESDRAYQSTITDLQSRVDTLNARPEPAIRLCKPSVYPVRVSAPSAGAHAATDRGPAAEAGEDIRPRLVSYGRDCEAIRRQLTALQEWVAEQR